MVTKEEQEKTKIKIAKDEQELRAKMKAIGDYEAKCKLGTWGITLTVLIVLEVMQFLFGFQIGILGMFLVGFGNYSAYIKQHREPSLSRFVRQISMN